MFGTSNFNCPKYTAKTESLGVVSKNLNTSMFFHVVNKALKKHSSNSSMLSFLKSAITLYLGLSPLISQITSLLITHCFANLRDDLIPLKYP